MRHVAEATVKDFLDHVALGVTANLQPGVDGDAATTGGDHDVPKRAPSFRDLRP